MTTQLARLPRTSENLFAIPGCHFTEVALSIEPGMKFEHWERLVAALRRAERGIQWYLGDALNYGEQEYGERYAQVVDFHDKTDIAIDTLRGYQWVAESVKDVVRKTSLPWSYHQAVAALKPKAQKEWLAKAEDESLTYRELKRAIEKSERSKNFKLVNTILERIWERIEDGCYTAEKIMKCSECGSDIFHLDGDEIKLYMQQLVGSGRAEWRKQGGKKEEQRGDMVMLCVPAGLPAGNEFTMGGYRPVVEYDDDEEHF
jgi:hypothetical protein